MTNNKPRLYLIPILGPIFMLLASPELVLVLAALVVDYLIARQPGLTSMRTPMIAVASAFFALLITGHLAERLNGRSFLHAFASTFGLLLHSRKFWLAVGTVGADFIVALIPGLQPVQSQLMTLITMIGLASIGSIAWEDTATNNTPALPPAVTLDTASAALTVPAAPGLSEEDVQKIVNGVLVLIRREMVQATAGSINPK